MRIVDVGMRAPCGKLGLAPVVFACLALGSGSAEGQSAPVDPTPLQRQLIADLTGWTAAHGQTVPFSRSTPSERAAAADLLSNALREAGLEPLRHRYRLRNINGVIDLLIGPYRGTNVYVELPAMARGEEAGQGEVGEVGEVVVVGAHYDSERDSPGAVDNASGVALVFAAARAIAALESRARTFMFVFFDQEEDDEVGSRAFAQHLLAGGRQIHSIHVVDLAAWDDDGDGAVEIQSPAPHIESLYVAAAEQLGIPLEVIGGASSDNKSFLAAGLPTVGVFQADMTPHIHRDTDTYETVDFPYLASMTRLVSTVLTRLARP